MEDLFKQKGWKWIPYKRTGDKWIQEDYSIEVKGKHGDGTYRNLIYTVRRTPGLVGQSTNSQLMNIGYKHKFSISLPREYPANLAKIEMRTVTRLWHPRIPTSGVGKACITVNGEVDRIFIDLIYNLLMDARRIRPPKLYPKEDSGMNVTAMRWFERDADNIHKTMLAKWDEKHDKVSIKETGGIRIITGESKTADPVKTDKSIKIIPPQEVQKEDEKKKGGVKII
ncbi:MAG: hypothetical protein ACTSXA_12045 [Candidatus Heimdallarchaeota archaeon]